MSSSGPVMTVARLRAIQATLPLRLYNVQTPTQRKLQASRAKQEADRRAKGREMLGLQP